MKKIYFVQVGFEFDGSVYLPYAAGTIIAYCQHDEKIKREYEFSDIIFRRERLEKALEKIIEPYIVAFSCSVWNIEYNKALARIVKERFPECLVVFGGHSVGTDGSLMVTEGYVDYIIFGEGEKTFKELLLKLPEGDLQKIDNIAYRTKNGIVITDKSCMRGLDDYPSAYVSGVFDKIVKENKGTDFLAVLETNRGCPYSCSYCDWSFDRKVRFFPLKKVMDEIKWLSDNQIAYCFCADSNFGMFERDADIAKVLVKTKKETGYPQVFRPCYEKNSADRVFEICSILNSVGMDKGATMAYQTLSPDALENVGRKNLTMEHFSSLMKKYNEAGIPTYSELILGLPGETKESFCKGICRLFENGQHNSVSVYHCEVLPNSEFARKDYIKKHKIEIVKINFNHIHSAPDKSNEVKEYSYIVRSTATLSREDWVYANLFSVCVQCFHSLGLLRFLAIYLRVEKGVLYYDFYKALLDYILNSSGKLNKLWISFKKKYETSLEGDWNYYNPQFGNVTWFFEEGAFLEIINDYDEYFCEIKDFINCFDIEEDFLKQLFQYQKMMIRKPFDKECNATFDYDFHNYFTTVIKGEKGLLCKRKCNLKIIPSEIYNDISRFAKETVWFGRRRGATVYLNNIEVK